MAMGAASLVFIFILHVASFENASASACVPIYGQCGGTGYTGETCCMQSMDPDAYLPFRSVTCQSNADGSYAMCDYQCSYEKPCLQSASICREPAGDNGAGERYCPYQSSCTNLAWCFDVGTGCNCRGNVPCRLNTRPGGCAALITVNGTNICPPVTRQCPGFEGEQCGGVGHNEPTTCQEGLECVKYSEYYSGCAKV